MRARLFLTAPGRGLGGKHALSDGWIAARKAQPGICSARFARFTTCLQPHLPHRRPAAASRAPSACACQTPCAAACASCAWRLPRGPPGSAGQHTNRGARLSDTAQPKLGLSHDTVVLGADARRSSKTTIALQACWPGDKPGGQRSYLQRCFALALAALPPHRLARLRVQE